MTTDSAAGRIDLVISAQNTVRRSPLRLDHETDTRHDPSSLSSDHLINQLQAQLEHARIPCGRHRTEVARAKVRANSAVLSRASELRVVPGVEAFGSELNPAA